MTQRPSKDPLSQEALREEIRETGLRATASRIAVLRLLRTSEHPVSHGDVKRVFREEAWDPATLYRNLMDFSEVGLTRRADVGDRLWRFEYIGSESEHDNAEHPHFVCTECGVVECLDGVDLQIAPGKDGPKALRRGEVEVQLRGRCNDCP